MRCVLDTNVLVSAFLWQGTPGTLIELASENVIRLFTSRVLLTELTSVLTRKHLVKKVLATNRTAAQMMHDYQHLATLVTARPLNQPVSRDIDDDAVLACAIAARADLIVTGDVDLLVLKSYQDIPIITPGQALGRLAAR